MVDGLFDRGAQNGCLVVVFREGSSKTMVWYIVLRYLVKSSFGCLVGVFLKRLKKESIRICSITRRPGEHLWHLFGKEQHRIGADMFNDLDAFGTPFGILLDAYCISG